MLKWRESGNTVHIKRVPRGRNRTSIPSLTHPKAACWSASSGADGQPRPGEIKVGNSIRGRTSEITKSNVRERSNKTLSSDYKILWSIRRSLMMKSQTTIRTRKISIRTAYPFSSHHLVPEDVELLDKPGPGVLGPDDVVDVAIPCSSNLHIQ